jgi:hypothetical protein
VSGNKTPHNTISGKAPSNPQGGACAVTVMRRKEIDMFCNSCNNGVWIIILIILLFGWGGNGFGCGCGCDNNNNGCGCGCN